MKMPPRMTRALNCYPPFDQINCEGIVKVSREISLNWPGGLLVALGETTII